MTKEPFGLALRFVLFLILVSRCGASFAEKLVDPNSVALEYRAAAEKRRAEQLKLSECKKKADEAKVLPRDRASFVTSCLEK